MSETGGTPQPGVPVPGWYHDPHGIQRWWDGTQWTENIRVQEAESILPPMPEYTPPPERNYLTWMLAMVFLLVVLVGGALLIVGRADDKNTNPTDVIPSGDATTAQTTVRSAQVAIETYTADHDGSYAGATPEALAAIEPTLQGQPVSVSAQDTGYTVTASAGDVSFTITRAGQGVITYTCTPAGSSGCDASGTWGLAG